MPCYHPLGGYRGKSGQLVTWEKKGTGNYFEVPCGNCIGCRLDRSRDWAVRCVHEAQMQKENSFITLTYDDEHLPRDGSLKIQHFQTFMKRLRKHYSPKTVRFFHCGEYGEKYQRPHYHACLFGTEFEDQTLFNVQNGQKNYQSETLQNLWPHGISTTGNVTWQSAGYVARYIMKKVVGDLAKDHYSRTNVLTGEVIQITPEYTTMSRRPGLGKSWYDKYHADVYPHDYVIIDGRKLTPPRYYDKLLHRNDPDLMDQLKADRELRAHENSDNSDARLRTREYCQAAKLRNLPRTLDAST